MDRVVTSMAFCEAPMDFAYGAKLAADARAAAGGDVSSRPGKEEGAAAAETSRDVAARSQARVRGRQVECAPAFDGLNCLETLVMPSCRGGEAVVGVRPVWRPPS